MKEDIIDILFLFGIAIFLWIISCAMISQIFVWLLIWGLKFASILFVIGGIVSVVNTMNSYRDKKNNKS